jgi:hypothetical protein
MSRITFGYHLKNISIIDGRACEDIRILRDNLEDLRNGLNVDVKAWHSIHANLYSSIRIRLEGGFLPGKRALEQIISTEGLPSFVDKPTQMPFISKYIMNHVSTKHCQNWPTTHDLYDLMKSKYSEEKIKTSNLSDGTLAINIGYI